MKLDVTNKSIQKVTPYLGFGWKSNFKNLQAANEVTNSHTDNFLFHLLTKSPIQSQFTVAVGALIQYYWLNTLIHTKAI